MVSVGLMYPQGYFHQRITVDGWQEEIYSRLDFDKHRSCPCSLGWGQDTGQCPVRQQASTAHSVASPGRSHDALSD